jgi:hypothetical protein
VAPDVAAARTRLHNYGTYAPGAWGTNAAVEQEKFRADLALTLADARRETVEACAQAIPTTWLDPLLSGPGSPLPEGAWSGSDIERLLGAVAVRIRSLLPKEA